jgi:hypothetical protein
VASLELGRPPFIPQGATIWRIRRTVVWTAAIGRSIAPAPETYCLDRQTVCLGQELPGAFRQPPDHC